MSDWLTILADAAQSEWKQGRALNIARIPSIFKQHDFDYRGFLSGRGLREALSLSAGEKLKLVNNPDDALVWGVIPSEANLDGADTASLFKKSAQNERTPRFKRSFWTAFIKQMPEEERRFILNDGSFIHISKDKIPDQTWREILTSDIVNSDLLNQEDYDKAVLNNIKDWCSRNSLIIDDFFVGAKDQSGSSDQRDKRELIVDLSRLSEQDLSRINIPLDLVIKLFRK